MSGVTLQDNSKQVFSALTSEWAGGLKAVAELVTEQARANVLSTLNTTGLATGALAEDVHYVMMGNQKARVGVSIIYGRIHEIGGVIQGNPYLVFQTADGEWHKVETVQMPARPWLRPAALMAMGGMGSAFGGAMHS